MATKYEKVEGSMEAALGAGILSAILEREGFPWIKRIEADPDQTGAQAEIFVTMRGVPDDVILRLHVTEVRNAG